MKIQGEERRAVEFYPDTLQLSLINQLLLPHEIEFMQIQSYIEAADAITRMVVRGAPAIGATGAYALALAAHESRAQTKEELLKDLSISRDLLVAARPTANDLRHWIDHVLESARQEPTPSAIRSTATQEAVRIAEASAEECRLIGEAAYHLIKGDTGVLTHCNAGALATVDHGTALAPIRRAAQDQQFTVYIGRTGPHFQGARLTTWELAQENIHHVLVDDNAVFHHMATGEISLVIVGCDRVALNGDVANKIGTLGRAIAAKHFDLPFYVALPRTTFDKNCPNGSAIPLEEREADEILYTWNGPRLAPKGTPVRNFSFDITPTQLITGYITSQGIFSAHELKAVFR
ncbi:MAG: S-methyl-5-thioribose-1-phosphate isomerase [Candidatus Heimdallarchaeota archaeon]